MSFFTLGKLLSALYEKWTARLREQGVAPAPYVVRRTTDVLGDAGRGRSGPPGEPPNEGKCRAAQRSQDRPGKPFAVSCDESLLTLDKLRKLLSGELEVGDAPLQAMSFSQRFAREFDNPFQDSEPAPSEFAATVPAAFEA